LPELKSELGVGSAAADRDCEEEWETVDERTVLLDYSKI